MKKSNLIFVKNPYFYQQQKRFKSEDVTKKVTEYSVTFSGNMGKNSVTPRGLNSSLANNLVCV